MGVVYRAHHTVLHRPVAIKVLYKDLLGDTEHLSRFQLEARVVNDIRHPNIVDIHDFIDVPEPRRTVAYVMELLSGRSLSDELVSGPLTVVQTRNVGHQLANALRAVHRARVIHRDLKPDNIMLVASLDTPLDRVPSVKILDFGIAKSGRVTADHNTATGIVMGTPPYMAPEQILGAQITAATDVYALCEILFECLVGERMFAGERADIIRAKLDAKARPVLLPRTVPHRAVWTDLIQRGTSFDASDRPCVDEVIDVFDTMVLSDPIAEPTAVVGEEHHPGSAPSTRQDISTTKVTSRSMTAGSGRPLLLWSGLAVMLGLMTLLTVVAIAERVEPAPVAAVNTAPSNAAANTDPTNALVNANASRAAVHTAGEDFGDGAARRPVRRRSDDAQRPTKTSRALQPKPRARSAHTGIRSTDNTPPTALPRQAGADKHKVSLRRYRITSMPTGARVFDGARLLGRTPLTVTIGPRDRGTLRFERDGCRPMQRNVRNGQHAIFECAPDDAPVDSEEDLKPW